MQVAKRKLKMFWSDDLEDDLIASMLARFGIGPIEVVKKIDTKYVIVLYPNGELGACPLEILKPIESQKTQRHSAHHLD